MIEVTRLNGKKFMLNPQHVEILEASPDTTIRLANGKTLVVKEKCSEVANAMLVYQQAVMHGSSRGAPAGWNVVSTESSPERPKR